MKKKFSIFFLVTVLLAASSFVYAFNSFDIFFDKKSVDADSAAYIMSIVNQPSSNSAITRLLISFYPSVVLKKDIVVGRHIRTVHSGFNSYDITLNLKPGDMSEIEIKFSEKRQGKGGSGTRNSPFAKITAFFSNGEFRTMNLNYPVIPSFQERK